LYYLVTIFIIIKLYYPCNNFYSILLTIFPCNNFYYYL